MFETRFADFGRVGLRRDDGSDSRAAGVCDSGEEIRRYFRDRYPVLLDGALAGRGERGVLVRRAKESLARGRGLPGSLPAAILRETLDAIPPVADRAATRAGLTAVGPKQARVWWDRSVIDNLDDVLARLDRPRPVLRFYDVTGLDPEAGRWNETFDIDVGIGDEGYTAQFAHADRTYIVDLGYIYADGRFLRLARTNTATLPREGQGAADTGETSRCLLRARARRSEAFLTPDAEAAEWVASRPDSPERDIEAELAVHMLYRAFLDEGPRALRRAPRLVRRDAAVLEREYLRRGREKRKSASRAEAARVSPVLLAVRLDAGVKPASPVMRYQLFRAARPAWMEWAADDFFDLFRDAAAVARSGYGWEYFAGAVEAEDGVTLVDAEVEPEVAAPAALVRDVPVNADLTASLFATPVFQAARTLRDSLTGMPTVDSRGLLNDGEEVSRAFAAASLGRRIAREEREDGSSSDRVFGGVEAKRMAKAGVKITRMALTLEGRMRPGARLKVAGRLVHADAEGRFRLECVLSGKKASIPVRAGVSVGGEARSLINVEWEKRASREKKKVY